VREIQVAALDLQRRVDCEQQGTRPVA